MTRASKCDRCDKYFDWHSDETDGFAFLTYDHIRDRYKIDSDEYDLCPECVKDLYNWLDNQEGTQQ